MKYINTAFGLVFFALFSFNIWADDVPKDNIGAQKLDQLQCIDEENQRCIDDVCLNSDQVDCQDNCKKLAKDKCQEQLNE